MESLKNTSSQRTVLIFFHDFLLFSFCMIVYDYTNIVKMISCRYHCIKMYPFLHNTSPYYLIIFICFVPYLIYQLIVYKKVVSHIEKPPCSFRYKLAFKISLAKLHFIYFLFDHTYTKYICD